MNHQLAEFKHECGTINVYDKGIVIEVEGTEVFISEDFVANHDLFGVFLILTITEMVTGFGGTVSGGEGQAACDQLVINHVGDDLFILTDDNDGSPCLPVNRSFLALLRSLCADLIMDGRLPMVVDKKDWSIRGILPRSGLTFLINEKCFEIYAKTKEGTYIFATTVKDQDLWLRALDTGRKMLDEHLPSGSWQVLGFKDAGDKGMQLTVEGCRIVYSLLDPTLPDLHVGVYMDNTIIDTVDFLLEAIWSSRSNRSNKAFRARVLLDDDDDLNDDEGED